MKLGEGNVFTVVCQSFCPEGVGIWYHVLSWDGYLWYQVPSKGGYIQGVRGWVCPDGGYAQRGGYVQGYPPTYPLDKGPRGWIPTPPPGHMGYSRQAGGTHPIGMLSCFVMT